MRDPLLDFPTANGFPVLPDDTGVLLDIRFNYHLDGLRSLEAHYRKYMMETVRLIARVDDPGPALYRVVAMYQRSLDVVGYRVKTMEASLN